MAVGVHDTLLHKPCFTSNVGNVRSGFIGAAWRTCTLTGIIWSTCNNLVLTACPSPTQRSNPFYINTIDGNTADTFLTINNKCWHIRTLGQEACSPHKSQRIKTSPRGGCSTIASVWWSRFSRHRIPLIMLALSEERSLSIHILKTHSWSVCSLFWNYLLNETALAYSWLLCSNQYSVNYGYLMSKLSHTSHVHAVKAQAEPILWLAAPTSLQIMFGLSKAWKSCPKCSVHFRRFAINIWVQVLFAKI